MRHNVRAFVESAAAAFNLAGPVYEFGSYQVHGQEQLGDLRPLFDGAEYTGCDMRPGPGVDRVEDLSGLTLPDRAARVVVCVDTLEHVFDVPRAVAEMTRVLDAGGCMLIAAPMRFHIHEFPSDYWRLTPCCVARLLAPLAASVVGWQGTESFPHTVFGIGCKAPAPRDFASQANRFIELMQGWLTDRKTAIPPAQKLKSWLRSPFISKGERRSRRDHHAAQFMVSAGAASSAAPRRREANVAVNRGRADILH